MRGYVREVLAVLLIVILVIAAAAILAAMGADFWIMLLAFAACAAIGLLVGMVFG